MNFETPELGDKMPVSWIFFSFVDEMVENVMDLFG